MHMISAESMEKLVKNSEKGLWVNMGKTKIMVSCMNLNLLMKS